MPVRLPVSDDQIRLMLKHATLWRDQWIEDETAEGGAEYSRALWTIYYCRVALGELRAKPGGTRRKCRAQLEELAAAGKHLLDHPKETAP